MPRGGRRRGAGRKLSARVIEFREFWRRWFDSQAGRRHLVRRARASDAILAKLIDKCFPTPTELTGAGGGPVLHKFLVIEEDDQSSGRNPRVPPPKAP